MTELRKKVLAEIKSYKDDLIGKENLEKNLDNLYDYINDKNNLKDDQDIRIFLYANRDHAAVKPFSNDTDYTAINQIITGKEPNLIKEDIKLKEVFGETYAEPGVLESKSGKDLKKLTDESKVDFYDALKALEDEEVKKAREDAFYGTNWLQQLLIPRTYERRMRGDDAEFTDLGLDVLENAAYTFLPTGRVAGKVLPKIPGVGKVIQKVKPKVDKVLSPVKDKVDKVTDNTPAKVAGYVANATAAPFAMEGIDALAYDDNENTDRKDFSLIDAGIGAGVNLLTPAVIKGPAGGIANILGGTKYGPKMGDVISKAGYGKSISDISKEARTFGKQKYDLLRVEGGLKNQQNRIKTANETVKEAEEYLSNVKSTTPNDKLAIEKAEQNLNFLKAERDKLENTTKQFVPDLNAFSDKMGYKEYDDKLLKYIPELENLKNTQKFKKGPTMWGTYKQKAKLVDEVLETSKLDHIDKLDARKELLGILKDVKFDSDIDAEKFILDFVSNKFGDNMFKDRASSLPVIGDALKKLNDSELKEKRQKVRDSFSKMLLPEVKPDTTKESK